MMRFPRRFVFVCLLCSLLATASCRNDSQASKPPSDSSKLVEVQIDFNGHGENKQFPVSWSSGQTAFSCLKQLEANGKLTVASKGSGSQTLLTAIDGLENRWSAGDNWVFTVNDRLGDRSSAVFDLRPGDRLIWRFGKYKPD